MYITIASDCFSSLQFNSICNRFANEMFVNEKLPYAVVNCCCGMLLCKSTDMKFQSLKA